MTDLPDPRHLVPAGIVALVAITVRATLADKPRPWRVVLLEAVSTGCLALIAYYGSVGLPAALGGPLSPEFAVAASCTAAVLGWAVIVRVLRRVLGIGES